MIDYDLIITASHRPHLLGPTLESFLAKADQPPARILIHDDAVLPFRAKVAPGSRVAVRIEPDLIALREETKQTLISLVPHGITVVYKWSDPPLRLGMALRWLLDNVRTNYVVYSQDDFVSIRPLPIAAALAALHEHDLNQIRFNKRATLAKKDTWQGGWTKEEVRFPNGPPPHGFDDRGETTLTVSDHWYFQLGAWRVDPIRAAIVWVTATQERRAILEQMLAEEAVNHVMDGRFGAIPGLAVPHNEDAVEPRVRRQMQRTFIWGGIGEDRYIRHIGGADPTSGREIIGGVDDPARAWREIHEHGA